MIDFENIVKPLLKIRIKSHQIKGDSSAFGKEFFSFSGLYNPDMIHDLIDCIVSGIRKEFVRSLSQTDGAKKSIGEIKSLVLNHHKEALRKINLAVDQLFKTQIGIGNEFDAGLLDEQSRKSIGYSSQILNNENFVFNLDQIFSRIHRSVEQKFEFESIEREILFGLNLEGALQFPYDENSFLKPRALPYLKNTFEILSLEKQIDCTYEEFENLFKKSNEKTSPIFLKKPALLRGIIKSFNDLDLIMVDVLELIKAMKGKITFDHCDIVESEKKMDSVASNWTKDTNNSVIKKLRKKYNISQKGN